MSLPALKPTHAAPPATPRIWPIAWPLFTELLLGLGVGLLGTVWAARLGPAAAGAFSLAMQVVALLFLLFRIVGAGVGVVVAQRLGAGRAGEAAQVARASMGAATALGGSAALLAWAGAANWPLWLNSPPEVAQHTTPLLQALAPAMLLDAWVACGVAVLRAHLAARRTLGVVLLMLALQLGLSLWWMPAGQFGLVGFAAAFAVSRIAALVALWLLWRGVGLHLRASDLWRLPREPLRDVLRIGAPAAAENIAYRLAFLASMAVVGQLGTGAMAVHGFVFQLGTLAMLGGLAAGLAAEVVVGHLVGAGALRQADQLLRRALGLGLIFSTLLAAAMAATGPWWLQWFTQDPALIQMGVTLMWCHVLVEPGRTFNLVVINALRATGDARHPVFVGSGVMLIVLAGGSWLLGLGLGWGLVGVWLAYAADEWLRGLLMWRRWRSLAWVRGARRVRRVRGSC
ncbi:MATE family efflux transporter [Ideonella sp.]|uniref:MATE family efflux transporter n=1 Tax=Ideonella sp. TaxID=1929293 RepID=UPI0037BFC281